MLKWCHSPKRGDPCGLEALETAVSPADTAGTEKCRLFHLPGRCPSSGLDTALPPTPESPVKKLLMSAADMLRRIPVWAAVLTAMPVLTFAQAPGQEWDHRFVISAWDPVSASYRVMVDEKRKECTAASPSGHPFQSPQEDKRRLAARFGDCSSDEAAAGAPGSTWSMTCVGRGGRRMKLTTTSTISEGKAVLHTEVVDDGQAAGDRPLRMLREYVLAGNCAPAANSR